MTGTSIKTVDKVNEDFVNQLIFLGMDKEKAVEMASLFLFSWIKSKGESIDMYEYEKDVNIFLNKLKEKKQK